MKEMNDNYGDFFIFRQVQEMTILVLRNVWGSNPHTFRGYQEKTEGWRIFIPTIWHDEVATVSLMPIARDPKIIEVNSKDNLLPRVDYRIKTWVAQYPMESDLFGRNIPAIDRAATRFALMIKEEERTALEDHWSHVAINAITAGYDTQKLTSLNTQELRDIAKEITIVFNQEMKLFGIQGEIRIQNIFPPKTIEAASAQKTVAGIRRATAEDEAMALQTKITTTGANPTLAYLAEALRDVFGSLLGAKGEEPLEEKRRKEKKNE